MKAWSFLVVAATMSGCAAGTVREPFAEFRVTDSIADGIDVIVVESVIPPNTSMPPHYHPGEEIVLVLEGSAVQVEKGQPDREIRAGERLVIPAGVVHAPRIGSDGARIISIRLQPVGQDVTIPAPAE